MLGEQPPNPGQGVRGGLVPGHEQGHGLVPELRVGHRPLLVAGPEEHREQVAPVFARFPALGDHPVDDGVELGHGAAELAVVAGGNPFGEGDDLAHPHRERIQDQFHRGAGLGALAGHVGVEQGLCCDLESHLHHVGLGVAGLSVAPARHRPLGGLDHHGGVAADLVAVEGGLRELPLPSPKLALGGQEAVAERAPRVSEREMLDEAFAFGDQNFFDGVGVADHDDRPGTEPELEHVAVAPHAVFEESETMVHELAEVPLDPMSLWTSKRSDRHRG